MPTPCQNTRERVIRAVAGTFVLLSLTLGYFVSPYFWLFTAFVGANLLQSSFTKACPLDWMLKLAGVQSCSDVQKR